MGSDDFFKKKRSKLPPRKKETLTPRPNSFLIVSEGEKTEPQYFDGLANYINRKYGHSISSEKPLITPIGQGRGTVRLVEAAAKIAARASIIYSQVWVVFDRDRFLDFDDAIILAKEKGFYPAWSNQSFEYWIYLHFNYSDAALTESDWERKLDKLFENGYKKNDPNIFTVSTTCGNLRSAVNRAAMIEKLYPKDTKPSQCDPCTTVHHLILALEPYISELL